MSREAVFFEPVMQAKDRAGVESTGERFVTRQELAQIMGLSVRTIDSMVRAGMPSETWGRRTRRLLASEAISWAREQGR